MDYPVFNNKMLQQKSDALKTGVRVDENIILDCGLNGCVEFGQNEECRYSSPLVYVRDKSMPDGVYKVEMLSDQSDEFLESIGLRKTVDKPRVFGRKCLVSYKFDKNVIVRTSGEYRAYGFMDSDGEWRRMSEYEYYGEEE